MNSDTIRNTHSDRTMTATEAAYFAGFVDGEGTITVIRSRQADRRSGWKYQPTVNVANSDLPILRWLRDTCGNGWIKSNFHKKVLAHHRTVYQLRLTANQMRHVLPQLLPYLRVKKTQAVLLLEFLEFTKRRDGLARSDEYWARLEDIRCRLSTMNPRGNVAAKIPDVLTMRPSRQGINQFTKQIV